MAGATGAPDLCGAGVEMCMFLLASRELLCGHVLLPVSGCNLLSSLVTRISPQEAFRGDPVTLQLGGTWASAHVCIPVPSQPPEFL